MLLLGIRVTPANVIDSEPELSHFANFIDIPNHEFLSGY